MGGSDPKDAAIRGRSIAYLVLAHTDPTHLGRLLRSLDLESDFFVHLDAKAPIAPFRDQPLPHRTYFCQDRIRVFWASYSSIEATVRMMEAALTSGREYSHLVLLSGQDYPIKPTANIRGFLLSQPNREFIRFLDMRESPDHYMNHLRQYWLRDYFPGARTSSLEKVIRHVCLRIRRLPVRKAVPRGMVPCFGSQWWAMTPGCARHVVHYHRANPGFGRFYRTAFAPEEHLFHTIVANSPFCAAAGGIEPFMAVGTARLANLHLLHPSLTRVYDLSHFDEIATSQQLFVRKVSTRVSGALLDRIDDSLRSGRCAAVSNGGAA